MDSGRADAPDQRDCKPANRPEDCYRHGRLESQSHIGAGMGDGAQNQQYEAEESQGKKKSDHSADKPYGGAQEKNSHTSERGRLGRYSRIIT